MAYIYKIENDINQKIYVGKTVNTIEERWREHCLEKDRSKDRPLYRAMNKYGIEHFHISMIEECEINILSEREIYWIGFYNSYRYGYNATLGGEGKILYDYDYIVNLYKQGKSIYDIMNEIGCCSDTIYTALRAAGFNTKEDGVKKNVETMGKPCSCFLNGKLIQRFLSINEASNWIIKTTNTSANIRSIATNIGRVCNHVRKTAYGYTWSYIDENDTVENGNGNKSNCYKRPIL